MATILGGTGADTLDFNSTVEYATVLGGSDTLTLIDAASAVSYSTLRGGTGNDTINVAGAINNAVIAGGSGVDSFSFSGGSTGSSVFAGAGNDSVYFSAADTNASTTYYFGKTDGKDTLSFGALTGSTNLVVAVDAAYGATSGIQFSGDLDAATGTSGTITFNNAELVLQLEPSSSTTSLASEAAGAGLTYVSFVTVSTATITALG